VKREVVDPILQQLALRNIKVDFADCWEESGNKALPINLLRGSENAGGRGGGRPLLVLSLCALFLTCSAIVIGLNKYEAALARLEAEAADAKAKAFAAKRSLSGVEASLAEIAELRRLKTARPPVIRVLDELTRVLPDNAWVSNFKMEGDAIEVTIVASTTGDLLPALGRSSLFTAADLTSPVTYDPAGQSERATVRLMLKPPASAATPAQTNETVGSKT
jgi:general secretion pathway protein L